MKKIRLMAVIVMISLLLVACGGSEEPAAAPVDKVEVTTSSYPAMGVAELDAFLKENAGKPTLLLFWTTWCPSCKQAIPEMEALKLSHGDRANIITVSLDEDVKALDAFFNDKKIDLPVYRGDEAVAQRFGVEAIPTLVIFDKSGKAVFAKPGAFPLAMLQKVVDDMSKK